MTATDKMAKLTINGKEFDLPVHVGTEEEVAIDITKLRAQSGAVTLDSGLMNTGATKSAVTFLDGEKGILRYRGVPIEELAESSTFIETALLLIDGELPKTERLDHFNRAILQGSCLPDGIIKLIQSFPLNAHPMAILSSAVVALSAYYPELCGQDLSKEEKEKVIPLMMGLVKSLSAMIYRHQEKLPLIDQGKSLNYCEDFLSLMTGQAVDEDVIKALDVLLILHADHEQNCSTSTVRVVGSSNANLFASLSAGIDALWGPLHGGANQAVLEMLEEIQNGGGDYKQFLERAKDKNDSFRLMGFGHRVYKNFDPRAKIIKKACDSVLAKLGVKDPLLNIAKGLEAEALKDPYFVDRKLYPNVDFYSGIIYRALGIPTNMFTVMFALGRLPGWMAQWKEMIESSETKIVRPRQIYTGHTVRSYTKISQR